MNIDEEIELIKVELQNTDIVVDVKHNPVISGAVSVLKGVPFWGELVDSAIETKLLEHQENKQKELLNLISKSENLVTSDMVNDVEFILNYLRVRDAVSRLANNDKIVYFANLLKNGYLVEERMENDEFVVYMDIINTLSYREMLYLTFMWEYAVSHQKRIVHNHWHDFSKKFNLKFPNSNVCMVYKRLTRTAFISEVIETANVEGETLSLDVEFIGYEIEPAFKRFYKVVLEKAK